MDKQGVPHYDPGVQPPPPGFAPPPPYSSGPQPPPQAPGMNISFLLLWCPVFLAIKNLKNFKFLVEFLAIKCKIQKNKYFIYWKLNLYLNFAVFIQNI